MDSLTFLPVQSKPGPIDGHSKSIINSHTGKRSQENRRRRQREASQQTLQVSYSTSQYEHVAGEGVLRRGRKQRGLKPSASKSPPPLRWHTVGPPDLSKSNKSRIDGSNGSLGNRPQQENPLSLLKAYTTTIGLYSLPLVPRDTQELRSFQYFRRWIAPTLSGHNDSGFWEIIVPQIAETSTGVWHAVVALAALHEGQLGFAKFLPLLERVSPLFNFTFQQCNLSIQSLHEAVRSQRTTLEIMTSCFLHAIFEQALGDHHGLRQLKIAMRLFKQHEIAVKKKALSEEDRMILTYLGPMLAGTTLSPGDASDTITTPAYRLHSTLIQKPYFLSISEAQKCLDEILDGIFPLGNPLHAGSRLTDEDTANHLLESWLSRLHDLVTISSQKDNITFLRRSKLLSIRYCMAKISHGTQFYLDESRYDTFKEQFTKIVQLSLEFLALESILLGDRALEPTITFDDMIIQPLYLTAFHCRDPLIRRKAIAVLESVDRTEAALGSKIAAYVGTAVIQLEEAGIPEVKSCRDVSLHHRIRLQDIYYHPGDLANSNAYVSNRF